MCVCVCGVVGGGFVQVQEVDVQKVKRRTHLPARCYQAFSSLFAFVRYIHVAPRNGCFVGNNGRGLAHPDRIRKQHLHKRGCPAGVFKPFSELSGHMASMLYSPLRCIHSLLRGLQVTHTVGGPLLCVGRQSRECLNGKFLK